MRFGGRKLLYRIIARELHSKRFKYDNESYYFRKLHEIISENKITYLQESNKLFKKIEEATTKDFYLLPYLDENILNKINEINKKPSYSDVFPY